MKKMLAGAVVWGVVMFAGARAAKADFIHVTNTGTAPLTGLALTFEVDGGAS
jgi:hypothetical protein